MAANNFKVNPQVALSMTSATRLLNLLDQINRSFAELKLERLAMIQQKDGTAGDETDWVTMSKMYGFVTIATPNTPSEVVAEAAFAELDSFVGNAAASLEQCCARFHQ